MTSQPPFPVHSLGFGTGVPPEIKALLMAHNDMAQLAIGAVITQLSLYNSAVAASASAQQQQPHHTSLFDAVAYKIGEVLGEDPAATLDAISGLAEPIARRAIWKWEKLPYPVLRARRKIDDGTEQRASWAESATVVPTVDEWIIQNEKWLRTTSSDGWKGDLVNFFAHADVIFDNSTLGGSSRKILRPPLRGCFYCLDELRLSEVEVQPSLAAFREKFAEVTNNQLRGLDWSNLFVAGGMVLGAMLAVGSNQPALMDSSDIDMYIYGLQPPEANVKIEHLYTIFKSNLPPSADILAVRNSSTVTFFSQFPLRRLQIILKIIKTPKDVLLNFDLDICAMGFDGQDVWMLPRAARALETGCNVFTMDMIHGHYLSDRRATQEQRVFKYAYKGYGIRFLPRYADSIPDDLIEKKVEMGVKYVNQVLKNGLSVDHFKYDSNDLPIVSHYAVDVISPNTPETGGRSCLTGFELFCRHVALWRGEQLKILVIPPDEWATSTYEFSSAYIDTARYMYKWDATFTLDGLKGNLRDFNGDQLEAFLDAVEQGLNGLDLKRRSDIQNSVHPCTFSSDLRQVMPPQGYVMMPLLVPFQFFMFANHMIVQVLKEKGLPARPPLLLAARDPTRLRIHVTEEVWVFWTIDENIMWQQLDRRIDEVNEVLWSLRHTSALAHASNNQRLSIFKGQISRRSIRKVPPNELGNFAEWVAREAMEPTPEHLRSVFGPEFQWDYKRNDGPST